MNKLKFLLFSLFSLFFSLFSFSADIIPVSVFSVVDGDTIKVYYQKKKKSVRLIGIDAPESNWNRRVEKQAREMNRNEQTILQLGKMAKEKLKEYVKAGQVVYLEFDVEMVG